MTPDGPTPDERDALAIARTRAAVLRPYLSKAVWALQPIPKRGIGTMATDAHWRLYWDPSTTLAWVKASPDVAAGVVLHETCHPLRNHHRRVASLGASHSDGNVAGDLEINGGFETEGLRLPDDVIYPSTYGLENGMLLEEYYAAVQMLPRKPCPDNTEGVLPRCGSGAGNPQGFEDPAPEAGGPAGVSEAEADVLRHQVAHDIARHNASRPGAMPQGWVRWADTILAPKVNWRGVLRHALRHAIATRRGSMDYSYRAPSRRQIPEALLPGRVRHVLDVALLIDTSGSMTQEHLDQALAEVVGVLRFTGMPVRVLSCDTASGSIKRTRMLRDLKDVLRGGGGTDLRVGLDAVERLKPLPHMVIVITDGYTPWPDAPPRMRAVVVIIGDGPDAPKWAETVRVEIPR